MTEPDFLELEEVLVDAMIAIAERRLDKAGLASQLERLARGVG